MGEGARKLRVDSEVHRVRKLLEYTVKCIKAAMESENIIHGLVSNSTDFRSSQDECFLCDTGATVSIIWLQVARDNGLRANRLKTPRKIIEASGGHWISWDSVKCLSNSKS